MYKYLIFKLRIPAYMYVYKYVFINMRIHIDICKKEYVYIYTYISMYTWVHCVYMYTQFCYIMSVVFDCKTRFAHTMLRVSKSSYSSFLQIEGRIPMQISLHLGR